MKPQLILFAVGFPFLLFFPAFALSQTTWYVDDDNTTGPWDGTEVNPFKYIWGGINASENGDVVLVFPGSYPDRINFMGKAIHIKSANGPDGTTIDGNYAGRVVTFDRGEGPDSIIEGFTITHGRETVGCGIACFSSSPTIQNNIIEYNIGHGFGVGNASGGGGIYCENSSPLIANNTINGNSASFGGGICCYDSSPTITNNIIQYNEVYEDDFGNSGHGGGIYCRNSSPLITNNTIRGNIADGMFYADWGAGSGGGIFCEESSPTISNNLIIGNHVYATIHPGMFDSFGGGICCRDNSSPLIIGNIIIKNGAHGGGGGFYSEGVAGGIYCRSDSNPTITNNNIMFNTCEYGGGGVDTFLCQPNVVNSIVRQNTSSEGKEIEGPVIVSYSNVEGGWPGDGNIDADPLFVDADNSDFHLRFASPCIDAGSNDAPGLSDTDYEGDLRTIDGNWNGIAVVDMGADELLPEIAARFGSVNASSPSLANVLLLNGSIGDARRIYTSSPGSRIVMTLLNSPAASIPVDFALYWIWWEPGLEDIALQPTGIGVSCMPMPLTNYINGLPASPPICLANTIGHNWLLGNPMIQGLPPAPCTIFEVPQLPPGTYTFQGYILDYGSSSPYGVSLTNAIVLKVE